jgi:hypothetical protein
VEDAPKMLATSDRVTGPARYLRSAIQKDSADCPRVRQPRKSISEPYPTMTIRSIMFSPAGDLSSSEGVQTRSLRVFLLPSLSAMAMERQAVPRHRYEVVCSGIQSPDGVWDGRRAFSVASLTEIWYECKKNRNIGSMRAVHGLFERPL